MKLENLMILDQTYIPLLKISGMQFYTINESGILTQTPSSQILLKTFILLFKYKYKRLKLIIDTFKDVENKHAYILYAQNIIISNMKNIDIFFVPENINLELFFQNYK